MLYKLNIDGGTNFKVWWIEGVSCDDWTSKLRILCRNLNSKLNSFRIVN